MAAAEDKNWATKVIIDPLTEPEPSAVDGPGTHFVPQSPASATSRTSTNPFRRSGETNKTPHKRHGSVEKTGSVSTQAREVGQVPQNGHRPRASSDLRKEAFASESNHRRRSASHSQKASEEMKTRPRRSSSLRQRFPGDTTDQPLEMLKKDSKHAQRSPHLKKHHQPRPDQVDVLDKSAANYHHEGPYDAALLVRNSSYETSPVAALNATNKEALKATPLDKIRDSLLDHRPLDGTAMVPPGHRDAFGNLYEYEEGADLMREPGADYKRWPGVQYHPDDLKGKGEPSYSIEKALKEHDAVNTKHGPGGKEFELVERPRVSHEDNAAATTSHDLRKQERKQQHGSSSHARNFSDGVKQQEGSLRRRER